jgi:hypothetical protein
MRSAAVPAIGWTGLMGLLLAILSLGVIALTQAREIQRLRRAAWDVAAQLDGDPRGLTTGRAAAAALRALLVLCLIQPGAAAACGKEEEGKKCEPPPKEKKREEKKKEAPRKKPAFSKLPWKLLILVGLLPLGACAPWTPRDTWTCIGAGVLFVWLFYIVWKVPNG